MKYLFIVFGFFAQAMASHPPASDIIVDLTTSKIIENGWYSQLDDERKRTVLISFDDGNSKTYYLFENGLANKLDFDVLPINHEHDYSLEVFRESGSQYNLVFVKLASGYKADFGIVRDDSDSSFRIVNFIKTSEWVN